MTAGVPQITASTARLSTMRWSRSDGLSVSVSPVALDARLALLIRARAGKREPVHDRRSVRKMPSTSVAHFPDSSVPEALLQLIHHLVNGESCCPLAGRKLLECLKELSDVGLSAIGEEGMIDHPIPIGV